MPSVSLKRQAQEQAPEKRAKRAKTNAQTELTKATIKTPPRKVSVRADNGPTEALPRCKIKPYKDLRTRKARDQFWREIAQKVFDKAGFRPYPEQLEVARGLIEGS
jgi:hypothetical protein